MPSGTSRANLYGGFERGRRDLCGDEGNQQEGLIGSGLHDGYGKNRWGEYCRCGE